MSLIFCWGPGQKSEVVKKGFWNNRWFFSLWRACPWHIHGSRAVCATRWCLWRLAFLSRTDALGGLGGEGGATRPYLLRKGWTASTLGSERGSMTEDGGNRGWGESWKMSHLRQRWHPGEVTIVGWHILGNILFFQEWFHSKVCRSCKRYF